MKPKKRSNETLYMREIHTKASGYKYSPASNGIMYDERLTSDERFVMLYILSHEGKYVFNSKYTQTQIGMGRDRYSNAIKKLQEVGYLVKCPKIGGGCFWLIFESTDICENMKNDGFIVFNEEKNSWNRVKSKFEDAEALERCRITDSRNTDSRNTDSRNTDSRNADSRNTDSRNTDSRNTDSRNAEIRRLPNTNIPITYEPNINIPITDEPITDEPITDEPITNPTDGSAAQMPPDLTNENGVAELRAREEKELEIKKKKRLAELAEQNKQIVNGAGGLQEPPVKVETEEELIERANNYQLEYINTIGGVYQLRAILFKYYTKHTFGEVEFAYVYNLCTKCYEKTGSPPTTNEELQKYHCVFPADYDLITKYLDIFSNPAEKEKRIPIIEKLKLNK
jgi:hypothetical protein